MKKLKTLFICAPIIYLATLVPVQSFAQKIDSLTMQTDTLQANIKEKPKVDTKDINAFINKVKFYRLDTYNLQNQLNKKGTLNDNSLSLSAALNEIKENTPTVKDSKASPAQQAAAALKIAQVQNQILFQQEIQLSTGGGNLNQAAKATILRAQ